MLGARLRLAAAVAVGGVLLFPAASQGGGVTVTAAGGPVGPTWRWEPSEVSVPVGGKVTWVNPTSSLHHVTAYDGPWKGFLHVEGGGGEATRKFKKPGTYRYRCDIQTHSELIGGTTCVGQCGTVTVE